MIYSVLRLFLVVLFTLTPLLSFFFVKRFALFFWIWFTSPTDLSIKWTMCIVNVCSFASPMNTHQSHRCETMKIHTLKLLCSRYDAPIHFVDSSSFHIYTLTNTLGYDMKEKSLRQCHTSIGISWCEWCSVHPTRDSSVSNYLVAKTKINAVELVQWRAVHCCTWMANAQFKRWPPFILSHFNRTHLIWKKHLLKWEKKNSYFISFFSRSFF